MTRAEKELAIERVGSMVWYGGMDKDAAIWFVSGLYKVDWSEAETMVQDAMAYHMIDHIEYALKNAGAKHVSHHL